MARRPGHKPKGQLQDRGLFENYGAETALELLETICRHFTCSSDEVNSPSEEQPQLTPMVVSINSDPSTRVILAVIPRKRPIAFRQEIRANFRSFGRTHVRRGAEAAARLQLGP